MNLVWPIRKQDEIGLNSTKFIRSKGGPERLPAGITKSPKNWEIIGSRKGGNAKSRKGKGASCASQQHHYQEFQHDWVPSKNELFCDEQKGRITSPGCRGQEDVKKKKKIKGRETTESR